MAILLGRFVLHIMHVFIHNFFHLAGSLKRHIYFFVSQMVLFYNRLKMCIVIHTLWITFTALKKEGKASWNNPCFLVEKQGKTGETDGENAHRRRDFSGDVLIPFFPILIQPFSTDYTQGYPHGSTAGKVHENGEGVALDWGLEAGRHLCRTP